MAREENTDKTSEEFDFAEFWLSQQRQESTKEKFIRKVKENPFVPVGKFIAIRDQFYDFHAEFHV